MDPHTFQSTEKYLKEHPRPLLFAPGTVPAYSNYGAALAGYIVQRVSGEPFDRYIENHIFLPLGMQHSTFAQPLPERFEGMMSQGYRTASTPPQPYELVVTAPAGSVASTAADMARFMLAQLQLGRLGDYQMLDRPTAELMQSPSNRHRRASAPWRTGFSMRPATATRSSGMGAIPFSSTRSSSSCHRRGWGFSTASTAAGGTMRCTACARSCSISFWIAIFPTLRRPRTQGPGVRGERCEQDRRPLSILPSRGARLHERVLSVAADGDRRRCGAGRS